MGVRSTEQSVSNQVYEIRDLISLERRFLRRGLYISADIFCTGRIDRWFVFCHSGNQPEELEKGDDRHRAAGAVCCGGLSDSGTDERDDEIRG